MKLLSPYSLAGLELNNRVVMAPMTRTRADQRGDVPTPMMALYYAQRATAGLIISEATHISRSAVGYENAPGIFSEEQVQGWSAITSAVHKAGGKIFLQLFHTGRLSHAYFQTSGSSPLAPSAIAARNCFAYITNYVGEKISIPFGEPQPMTTGQIAEVVRDFSSSAQRAVKAGFDGVEIHAANGYLVEQFLNPHVNTRTDDYGGNISNRLRFLLEVVDAVAKSIGSSRTGLRISPFGNLHDMPEYPEISSTYLTLARELSRYPLAYLHVFDQSAFGTGVIPPDFISELRQNFRGTLMLNGGFDSKRAEAAIKDEVADLISFGRPFISNPDFVRRIELDLPLVESDRALWYGVSGSKGYTDYAPHKNEQIINA